MKRSPLRRLLFTLPLAVLAGGLGLAQPGQLPPRSGLPPVQAPADRQDDIEVLARGPIHEAFAATAEMPAGGPVVDKRPPDPVEELPPDQKPDGDNVQWMPGYWHFDEERKDFIWISGFWRDAPPGRVWVPGGWQEVKGGFQWVSGFWNVPAPVVQPGVAPQAQLEYLPPPPVTLETGPTLVSPGDDYFYTPGCWVYRVNRYVWRPGFWVEHRPNWVWVPDQYRWTPCGFVFVPGFWDVPLERRGVLFAPVFFRPAVVLRPRFVYTPVYAVPAPSLYTSLFVRTGYSGYYFGDYFEQRYATAGFNSWAVGIRGSNFAVGISGGRGFAYDPLWSYYSQAYRREPAWQRNIGDVYAGRFNGTVARPPRTLVQQTTIINNITNNTVVNNNNTTVVNNKTVNTAPPTAAQVTMLAPLADLKKSSPTVALKPVAVEDRTKEQSAARELRQVGSERRKAETQLVARGQVPVKADDKPQQVKVDMAKTAVARAQQQPTKDKAPPPAPAPIAKKPDAPTAPPTGAKPGDKPTVPTVPPKPGDPLKGPPAKNDPPKSGPGTPMPPVGPKPADPKPPVNPPKVDPPKPGDPPKGPPATPPKTDPPKGPPTVPPKSDPPKVDPPKGPPATPPVGPKPADPPKPKDPPKTDPPKGPPVTPPTVPPVGPKPSNPPKPKDPPKQDPPKPQPPTAPPIMPPKTDPPKAPPPPPKVDPPKPQPPAAPPPKVDPPKPPASPPPAAPPKVDAPKSNPPKGPGVPSRPTRGDDKKDDKKK